MDIKELAKEVHKTALSKGWYSSIGDAPERYKPYLVGAFLSNIHSEVSEANEEVRSGLYNVYYKGGSSQKPEGFVVEMADVIIRVLDTCEFLGLDIERAIQLKMAYNKTRPIKHGGKAF